MLDEPYLSAYVCWDDLLLHAGSARGFEVTAKGRPEQLVAVVDDDEPVRLALTTALKLLGFKAYAFSSAESFLSFTRLSEVACLISDVKMPGMTGLELHARLRRNGYEIPTVFMTAYGQPEARAQAMADGVVAFLDKPFDDNTLLETVKAVLNS
jgi:FixJ family two-component response regulator